MPTPRRQTSARPSTLPASAAAAGGDFHFDSFRNEIVEPDVNVDEVEDAFSGDEDAFSGDEDEEEGAYM